MAFLWNAKAAKLLSAQLLNTVSIVGIANQFGVKPLPELRDGFLAVTAFSNLEWISKIAVMAGTLAANITSHLSFLILTTVVRRMEFSLVGTAGIEPAFSACRADGLPLSDAPEYTIIVCLCP